MNDWELCILPLPSGGSLLATGGFGAFEDRTTPLSCLYVLQRRDPQTHGCDVEVVPVAPAEGVTELVRHSFLARIAEALGWHGDRLRILGKIAAQIPIRRVVYPGGFQHLSNVCDAILEDASRSP